MSVVVTLFMALLLFPLHACNGRRALGFVSNNEDNAEKATLDGVMGIKAFPTFEDTKKETMLGAEIISEKMDGNQVPVEVQGVKKMARFMVEAGSSQEKETKDSANENQTEEGVVVNVMDYVQAHRKSPIHNHH